MYTPKAQFTVNNPYPELKLLKTKKNTFNHYIIIMQKYQMA